MTIYYVGGKRFLRLAEAKEEMRRTGQSGEIKVMDPYEDEKTLNEINLVVTAMDTIMQHFRNRKAKAFWRKWAMADFDHAADNEQKVFLFHRATDVFMTIIACNVGTKRPQRSSGWLDIDCEDEDEDEGAAR